MAERVRVSRDLILYEIRDALKTQLVADRLHFLRPPLAVVVGAAYDRAVDAIARAILDRVWPYICGARRDEPES